MNPSRWQTSSPHCPNKEMAFVDFVSSAWSALEDLRQHLPPKKGRERETYHPPAERMLRSLLNRGGTAGDLDVVREPHPQNEGRIPDFVVLHHRDRGAYRHSHAWLMPIEIKNRDAPVCVTQGVVQAAHYGRIRCEEAFIRQEGVEDETAATPGPTFSDFKDLEVLSIVVTTVSMEDKVMVTKHQYNSPLPLLTEDDAPTPAFAALARLLCTTAEGLGDCEKRPGPGDVPAFNVGDLLGRGGSASVFVGTRDGAGGAADQVAST